LGLENRNSVVVMDDAVARRVAEVLGLRLTGTFGLLLNAKKRRLISAVRPVIDQLESLQFRVSGQIDPAACKRSRIPASRSDIQSAIQYQPGPDLLPILVGVDTLPQCRDD